MFPTTPDYKSRVEYRITDWLWKNMPDARVAPTGSVRFWFDAWHDLAQLGGGSEQGLLNKQVEPAVGIEPGAGYRAHRSVDAVHGRGRPVRFRPALAGVLQGFQHPEKVAGRLPVLFDDRQGNTHLPGPRRYPARARVVRPPIPGASNRSAIIVTSRTSELTPTPSKKVPIRPPP